MPKVGDDLPLGESAVALARLGRKAFIGRCTIKALEPPLDELGNGMWPQHRLT
jgi:hypothetical protein